MDNCIQTLSFRKTSHQHHILNDMVGEIKPYKPGKDKVRRVVDNTGRKRRIYSTIHNDPKQSSRRFRANDRERRRMNSLNGALQALKGCVPSYHGKKRLTKLQILKFACHYISDLSDILYSSSSSATTPSAPSPTSSIQDVKTTTHMAVDYTKTSESMQFSDTTSSCMSDELISFLVDQQEAQHHGHNNHNIIDNNNNNNNNMENTINGLSMMQRLDYLTYHNYFDNNNNAMTTDNFMSPMPPNHSVLYNNQFSQSLQDGIYSYC